MPLSWAWSRVRIRAIRLSSTSATGTNNHITCAMNVSVRIVSPNGAVSYFINIHVPIVYNSPVCIYVYIYICVYISADLPRRSCVWELAGVFSPPLHGQALEKR